MSSPTVLSGVRGASVPGNGRARGANVGASLVVSGSSSRARSNSSMSTSSRPGSSRVRSSVSCEMSMPRWSAKMFLRLSLSVCVVDITVKVVRVRRQSPSSRTAVPRRGG